MFYLFILMLTAAVLFLFTGLGKAFTQRLSSWQPRLVAGAKEVVQRWKTHGTMLQRGFELDEEEMRADQQEAINQIKDVITTTFSKSPAFKTCKIKVTWKFVNTDDYETDCVMPDVEIEIEADTPAYKAV